MSTLLTTVEVAEMLRVPTTTLHQWRYNNRGPKGFKVGRHVRYKLEDVEAFIDAQIAAESAA